MNQSQIEKKIFKLCNEHNVRLATLFGIYFGYPECCIEAFENMTFPRETYENPIIGTGYLPCKSCSKNSKDELIARIAKHRLCDMPFPKCNDLINHKHFTDMVLYGDLINVATY